MPKDSFDTLKTLVNTEIIKLNGSRLTIEKSFTDIKDEVRQMVVVTLDKVVN